MDDKKYRYEIYRNLTLSGTGRPAYEGVLWAQDKAGAYEAAFAIARMHGVLRAQVTIEEIKLEVVK